MNRAKKDQKVVLEAKGFVGQPIQVIEKKVSGAVLGRQQKINTYNFPFTLNVATGCFYGCRYCYLQSGFFAKHTNFPFEMIVKSGYIDKLQSELKKYRDLPQHLRRVQIGPATESYHPHIIKAVEGRRGTGNIREVLECFLDEDRMGKPWMIHLVTKSPLILEDLDLIKRLKFFQAEITITTDSEEGKRQWEGIAPSVGKRFEMVQKLADAGIFVRIMAMPLFLRPEIVSEVQDKMAGADEVAIQDELERRRWENAQAIWDRAQSLGAKSFKAKGLNYFDAGQLNQAGEAPKVLKGRNEDPNREMLIHGGEIVRNADGSELTKEVQTWWYEKRDGKKKVLTEGVKAKPVTDFGYNLMPNSEGTDWGDCC